MTSEKKAVILLSGGLDSSTVLAIALERGFTCYCLSFSYGQRQTVELERAQQVQKKMGATQHLILNLELNKIGGSALTTDIPVPKSRSIDAMGESNIPVTYVPGRNTIFLSHAVAWAEVLGSFDIFVGVNALDYSGYPDCRPDFIKAMEQVANLGTGAGVAGKECFKIHAPLMHLTKKDIVELGMRLGVDYSITHSCYDPDSAGLSCGACDACLLRLKGFEEAGYVDPVLYQSGEST